jgi:hypothetical protein
MATKWGKGRGGSYRMDELRKVLEIKIASALDSIEQGG